MRRFLFLLTALLIVCVATAQTNVWDGSIEAFDSSDGKGTVENPILITNAAQLAYLAQQVNLNQEPETEGGLYEHFEGIYFELTTNLDLASIEWTPIGGMAAEQEGDSPRWFQGIFDGKGHTIANLKISADKSGFGSKGLFGYIGRSATVQNLGIISGEIAGSDRTAAIVGRMTSSSITTRSIILNCYNKANVTVSVCEGGGVAGWAGGDVVDCYNMGTITCTAEKNGNRIGGVMAFMGWPAKAVRKNVYGCGKIEVTAGTTQCGIVVGDRNNSDGSIANSYFNSEIQSGMNGAGWGADARVIAKTTAEMKSGTFAALLNAEAFMEDATSINEGYPILKWEVASASGLFENALANEWNVSTGKGEIFVHSSLPVDVMIIGFDGTTICQQRKVENTSFKLVAGIYLVKVSTESKMNTVKVLVQN